uniref:Uncharacterized protein n=1 Tax=Arundo donax TaxID=35708 RepID=A0A0A9DXZ6_ARUDO
MSPTSFRMVTISSILPCSHAEDKRSTRDSA